jgi:dienelactone hydrolase
VATWVSPSAPRSGRPNRTMGRAGLLVLSVTLALGAAACSSGSGAGAHPDLARPGAFTVGATTLDLGSAGRFGERLATVFYPADSSKAAGHPLFRYKLADPLPEALASIVPAKFNSTVTSDAHVDAPASHAGPFPIVLFSHGFGASRLYYSHILTGIASWGFVVVAADYLERGLYAQAANATASDTPALDLHTMLSSLTATETASSRRSSPLFGVADPHRVAAVGHSAGGQAAFDALRDPRVAMAVGWAPVGPSGTPSRKPVMIIGEDGDVALTKPTLTREFDAFKGPTTFLEISDAGHNTYTDICTSIRQGGGGLVGFAISLHLVSQELAKLAVNGCTMSTLPPQRFWPVVQDYTVGALRHGFGIDGAPRPGPAAAGQFPGFTITFRQHS